jgi:hypothetical protein
MATKFPEEEYKKLHQRVCKILYSQLTSSSPAQDATKLLEKLDASTKTKQEFLAAFDKKLQRFQDPVGWIQDKREGLEQICKKIDHRRITDPGFEVNLSQNGRAGLQIIFHVVRSDPSTLSVTSDDINKISVCMQELKNILPGSSAPPPAPHHHPHQMPAHHSLPPISSHHHIPSHIPQHISSHMNHSHISPPQMMSSIPSYHHQQNFNPSMMSHHPVVPQHSYPPPVQHHYPVQPIQPISVVPVIPQPVHPPLPSTQRSVSSSSATPSAPSMSVQSSSGSSDGSSSSSTFDDGIYGIIVIELQYLLKKCMEKPTRIKVQEITGYRLLFVLLLCLTLLRLISSFLLSSYLPLGKFFNLHQLLSDWSTKNKKHLDDGYQSRIQYTLQINLMIYHSLDKLEVDESATVDIIHKYPSIISSFNTNQLMIDETVRFEVNRLTAKNFDPNVIMKKKNFKDIEFQKRISDLFQNTIKLNQQQKEKELQQEGGVKNSETQSEERRDRYKKAITIYNNTTTETYEMYYPTIFGGMC